MLKLLSPPPNFFTLFDCLVVRFNEIISILQLEHQLSNAVDGVGLRYSINHST